jgi:short-subunit dehydrogenase
MNAARKAGGVAVITGAASGIGRSLALALAGRATVPDVRIALVDLEPAEQLAAELAQLGVQAQAFQCDITIEADVGEVARQVDRRFGSVNVLANVAGVNMLSKLHETSATDIEWLFQVNVFGLCHMVRAFVPSLLISAANGKMAHVINVASGFGVGIPSMGPVAPSAYAGTKHAVVGLSDAMRKELAADGIGVSVVCPGLVNTRTWNSMSFRQARFGGPVQGTAEARKRVQAWGQDPDKVADLILAGVDRGDFFILPLGTAGVRLMRAEIEERHRMLLHALGDDETTA